MRANWKPKNRTDKLDRKTSTDIAGGIAFVLTGAPVVGGTLIAAGTVTAVRAAISNRTEGRTWAR